MDSLGDPFFSSLLQEGSNMENQFMESQYLSQSIQVTQKESQFSAQTKSTSKKSRSGNFSIEEDNLLVSAWLNTSLDAVTGNDQKGKTFWRRVGEYFHENKTFISGRNDNSLIHRWSTIQLCTNKFCGYLTQIESINQSGVTEQDQISKAKTMYYEMNDNVAYQFEHCWNLLRYQPKWHEECEKKKPKRGRTTATHSPLAPDIINPVEEADTFVPLERPIGTKAEKENRKKRKSNDQTSSPIAEVLNEMKEDRKRGNEKKLQMLQKSYDLQAEKIRMEQMKEEERIMTIDTSGMTVMLQEYYHRRQMEIIERQRNKT